MNRRSKQVRGSEPPLCFSPWSGAAIRTRPSGSTLLASALGRQVEMAERQPMGKVDNGIEKAN